MRLVRTDYPAPPLGDGSTVWRVFGEGRSRPLFSSSSEADAMAFITTNASAEAPPPPPEQPPAPQAQRMAPPEVLNAAREMLGVGHSAPLNVDVVQAAYRAQAKIHHPDAGGDPRRFNAIQKARKVLLTAIPEGLGEQ